MAARRGGSNPRTVVRGLLLAMRADLALSLARWTVHRQMFLQPAERTDPNVNQRARLPWEWPEWRIDDWQVLDRELAHLAEQIADARSFASEQIRRLHCRQGCGRRLNISEARAGFTTCEHCPAPNTDRAGPAQSPTREE